MTDCADPGFRAEFERAPREAAAADACVRVVLDFWRRSRAFKNEAEVRAWVRERLDSDLADEGIASEPRHGNGSNGGHPDAPSSAEAPALNEELS